MLRAALVTMAWVSATACGEAFRSVAGQGGGGSGGSAQAAGGEHDGGAASESGGGAEAVGASAGEGGSLASGGVAATGGSGEVSGGGESGGRPELPISREGLELWFRADGAVKVERGVVSSWADESGKGRDASQTAANYRPALKPEGLNGKPAVVFDGQDDLLEMQPFGGDFSAGVSLFMVTMPSNQDTCQAYFELSNGSEVQDLHFGDYQGALLYEVASPFLNDVRYPLAYDRPIIAVAVHEPDGRARVRRNGNGVGTMTMELPEAVQRNRNYLGYGLYAGCVPMKGAISELALFSRAVDDRELLQMEAHLREKWACCDSD